MRPVGPKWTGVARYIGAGTPSLKLCRRVAAVARHNDRHAVEPTIDHDGGACPRNIARRRVCKDLFEAFELRGVFIIVAHGSCKHEPTGQFHPAKGAVLRLSRETRDLRAFGLQPHDAGVGGLFECEFVEQSYRLGLLGSAKARRQLFDEPHAAAQKLGI
jgi:hypothetical protein